MSEYLRCRSAVLGDSGLCPKSRRVDLLSRAFRPLSMACGVDQMSLAT